MRRNNLDWKKAIDGKLFCSLNNKELQRQYVEAALKSYETADQWKYDYLNPIKDCNCCIGSRLPASETHNNIYFNLFHKSNYFKHIIIEGGRLKSITQSNYEECSSNPKKHINGKCVICTRPQRNKIVELIKINLFLIKLLND
jgi:hypothetical protein